MALLLLPEQCRALPAFDKAAPASSLRLSLALFFFILYDFFIIDSNSLLLLLAGLVQRDGGATAVFRFRRTTTNRCRCSRLPLSRSATLDAGLQPLGLRPRGRKMAEGCSYKAEDECLS